MKTVLAAAALLSAFALPALAQQKKDCGALPPVFDGIAFTGDGDTIYGVGLKPGVRLWGLNAPELRDGAKAETVPGMRARALVADLLAAAGHKVHCAPIEWDGYCRVVATCTTGAGVDLTLASLQAGLAYGFYLARHPDQVETALKYSNAEAAARKERKGLWPEWLGEK
jgi:endonuclease YncB( thermonuclease family)